MECLEAQQLISAALDREPVDANALALAKSHCASCESCATYVRTLVAMHRVEAPAPPADLPDRVMAAVRAEAARAQVAAAAAEARAAAAPSSAAAPIAGGGAVVPLDADTRARLRRLHLSRGQWIAAASAAALLLVAAGFAALSGVRAIVAPTAQRAQLDTTMGGVAQESASSPLGAPAAAASDAAATANKEAYGDATVPQYITLGEDVYAYDAPVSYPVSTLQVVGTTNSTLQSGEAKDRQVYQLPDGTSVAVESDTGETLGFRRVTRMYSGRTYVLKSRPVTGFGVWPSLPDDVPTPQSNDGAPTFTMLGPDATGRDVYARSGSDASTGIGIAPDSPAEDPAAGNPNWTWWEPVR